MRPCFHRNGGDTSRAAFTLIELLVVISIIAVLSTMLAQAAMRARSAAQSGLCTNQLRQLFLANTQYAGDAGHFVAAAEDLFGANLTRWHGTRTRTDMPFRAAAGPLADYLGTTDMIRTCPAFDSAAVTESRNAFEAACGGYGYNQRGVGSRSYVVGFNDAAASRGMSPIEIAMPVATVMFCDTAFPQPYGDPTHLIEYSFAESYFFIRSDGPVETTYSASPSIHFRHDGQANVVWADGHVLPERQTVSADSASDRFNIGWFGGPDNRLFDPN